MRRIGSAVGLSALLLVTIWLLPSWVTLALAALAAGLAAAEVAGLSAAAGAPVPRPLVAVAAATVAVAFVFATAESTHGDRSAAFPAVLLALVVAGGLVTLVLGPPAPATLTRAGVLVMAPLYAGLPLGAFTWIQWTLGPGAVTWLLGVVAISDTAQYYAGRRFGRTKLAPLVSPAKTREGALGGLLGAALAGLSFAPLWTTAPGPAGQVGLAVLLALFGIAGDLFESLLKRSAGVKDSSTLIPGHGGVLDRLDSHLFAAPVFCLMARLLA